MQTAIGGHADIARAYDRGFQNGQRALVAGLFAVLTSWAVLKKDRDGRLP